MNIGLKYLREKFSKQSQEPKVDHLVRRLIESEVLDLEDLFSLYPEHTPPNLVPILQHNPCKGSPETFDDKTHSIVAALMRIRNAARN